MKQTVGLRSQREELGEEKSKKREQEQGKRKEENWVTA